MKAHFHAILESECSLLSTVPVIELVMSDPLPFYLHSPVTFLDISDFLGIIYPSSLCAFLITWYQFAFSSPGPAVIVVKTPEVVSGSEAVLDGL